LDAATKYPWPRSANPRKYGVYDADADVFRWLREGAPAGRRCLEAQVMDWADDIAYSVHDFEDGLHAGYFTLAQLRDAAERAAVTEVAGESYATAPAEELDAALLRLQAQPWWPRSYDGSHQALADLKNLTSQLIGRFCQAAERATREAHGGGPLRRYAADLVAPRAARLECAVLKAVTDRYVMRRERVTQLQEQQRELVADLVEALLTRGRDVLDPMFRLASEQALDEAGRLRVVIDQVASLTDTSAIDLHRRLHRY
jgi:dGTPase